MKEIELGPWWLGWVLTVLLGTLVNPFAAGGDSNLYSLAELPALLGRYALWGVLAGVVMGLGQAFFLSPLGPNKKHWFWATMLGHLVGYPAGLLLWLGLLYGLAALTGNAIELGGKDTFIIISALNVSLGAGLVIGLGQWALLHRARIVRQWHEGVLWVLGTIGGLGFGAIVASYPGAFAAIGYLSKEVGYILAHSAAGLIMGGVTATLLALLLAKNRATGEFDAAVAQAYPSG